MHLSGREYVETDGEGTVRRPFLWPTEGEWEYWLGGLELMLKDEIRTKGWNN